MSHAMYAEGARTPSLWSLPISSSGRLAAILLAVALAVIVLNAAVIMPFTESRTDMDGVQQVVNIAVALTLLVSGIVGSWAVIRDRERSWVVWLAVALTLVVLIMEITEGLAG
ncbi:MAG: hypothetical protein ACYC6C_06250 [Coriobacteriia bacterium]